MGFLAFTDHLSLLATDILLLGPVLTSWLASIHLLFSLPFYAVGGLVGDRVAKPVALAFFTALQAVGLAVAAFSGIMPVFLVAAVAAAVIGMGQGGRLPVSVAILADYFGTGSFGKILGLSGVIGSILSVFGSLLTAIMYGVIGSYAVAFLILAGLSLLGSLCFLRARNPQPPQARLAVEPG